MYIYINYIIYILKLYITVLKVYQGISINIIDLIIFKNFT